MKLHFSICFNILLGLILFSSLLQSVSAVDVKLDTDMDYLYVSTNGQRFRIEREQDLEHALTGPFAKTSRKCPPFCIHPMQAADGVTTIGEIELFQFVLKKVNLDEGLLVDSRTPNWYQQGTIPGSVNVPFTVYDLEEDAPELIQAMRTFGVRRVTDDESLWSHLKRIFSGNYSSEWDFSEAKDLAMFCNGLWCDQSPRAIRKLTALGYPPGKLYYYRGGMQSWNLLGLSIHIPN